MNKNKSTTNIIIALVVSAISILIIVIGWYIWSTKTNRSTGSEQSFSQTTTFYTSKGDCEQKTSKSCQGPLTCDYIPEGKTVDEVCGKGFFKGAWSAEN